MSTIFRDPVAVNGVALNAIVGDSYIGCDFLDGWDRTAPPTVSTAEFGYNDGVVAADRFPLKEKYVEIGGWAQTSSRLAAENARDSLNDMFDVNSTVRVRRDGPIPKEMAMRVVSEVDYPQDMGAEGFRWIVRLMAPWPFKTSPVSKTGAAGVYTGGSYFRNYKQYTAGRWARRYTLNTLTGKYVRKYMPDNGVAQAVPTAVRTNASPNPSAETDATTGLTAYAQGTTGTVTRTRVADTSPANGGAYSFEFTAAATSTAGTDRVGYYFDVPVVAGEVWSFGAQARRVTTAAGQDVELFVNWRTASASLSNSAVASTQNTAYTQLKLEGLTAPATATIARVHFYAQGGTTAVALAGRFDMIQVEKTATLGPYFDGNTAGNTDGTVSYRWQGTPNLSPSEQVQYVTPATPATVATSVDIYNAGNASGQPLLIVRGPLLAGAWFITNEATGERMSFAIDLSAGQDLVINTQDKTAYIGSSPVDYYLRGDWLTLPKKVTSRFRLATAEYIADARLTVVGYDTYK